MAKILLGDMEGSDELLRDVSELLHDLKGQLAEQFDSWCRDIQALSRDKALR